MFYLYSILFTITILLLIPIPIKLSFNYSKLNMNFYIYNFKLNLEKLMKLYKKKEKKVTAQPLEKKKKEFDLTTIFSLINSIENIKFKPTIRFNFYCNYGFIDASNTAIAYAYINSISPFLYKLLNKPFKIKSYDYNIKPDFQGAFLESSIHSIIFVNIIKIIYMLVFIKNKMNDLKR